MRRPAAWIAAAAAVAALAAGLSRLRLDVDVFQLLPSDVRMVEGLELYQKSFGSSRELVLSLRSPAAAVTEAAAGSLAAALESSGLASDVVWRSPLRDPSEVAELVAYLWLNQPPESFAALLRRLDGAALRSTLDGAVERMATSLSPAEVARLGRDPLGLTAVTDAVAAPMLRGAGDPFASSDGRVRVLFVRPPADSGGFWQQRRWVAAVRGLVDTWRRDGGREALTVRLTGTPAFVVETGSGLLRDMEGAAAGTLVLVAGLFWAAYRRWAPLAWLVVLLVAVLAGAAALGGVFLGPLNVVSLGFAAILLGLSADYALILYQELAIHPERSVAEHRAVAGPSILWAAATTAGAFFMIGRSSLPGLTQLGTLVALGVLIAAAVMLAAFLPPLARRPPAPPPERHGFVSSLAASPRAAWTATLLFAAASLAVLAQRLPAVDTGTSDLGPREGRASAALAEIRREVGGLGEGGGLWLIVEGADEGEVARRLAAAGNLLQAAVDRGLLAGYALPEALWPRPEAQWANRDGARRLAGTLGAAEEAASAAGFTDEALGLTRQVFAAWGRFARAGSVVWPASPGARWLFRQFAARDGHRQLALGRLNAAPAAAGGDLLRLSRELEAATGGTLFSWTLLSDSLLSAMRRDVERVLLPMGAVLLLLLGLAYRRPGEIVLSLAALGFSLVCLLALMALFGWSWNLMNVMALPLLFGAGVDYSIHVQLALRRHRGDAARVHRSVGRAILLCGASTASGFGTLAFASNAGLASLGRICATGIALAAVVSVLLLPSWWRAMRQRKWGRR